MIGITAYSAYVPRLRLDRNLIARAWGTPQAAGEIAVANYDEDALTMAAEVGLACAPDGEASAVDALYFASTSAPYREKQVASVVATACDLPRCMQTADFTGSVRAGMSALLAGVHAVRAGARNDVLIAAADARLAAPESDIEGLLGDAAAGVRIGSTAVLAEVVDAASVSEEFTHLWRTDNQKFVQAFPGKFSNTYGYARDLGEAIRALLAAQKLKPESIARLAVYSPDARAGMDLAKDLGFDPRRQLLSPAVSTIGSAGVADPLLALAAALDEATAGDWIVAGAYGEGADALLLRVTEELPRRRAIHSWKHAVENKLPLASYEKYLKFRRVLDLDEPGDAVTNVLEFKELKQNIRLYGSRCDACGTVQFPITRVCIKCRQSGHLSDHKLRKQGTIFTFTIDQLIANLEHPLPMAVVDLDGGGRVYLQVTDFTEKEVGIGLPVTLTFRRLQDGGGNHNYFWKARPVR
ncbi:MAG: OB-fold domain-containing protein [Candidatus Binatia bacterium]